MTRTAASPGSGAAGRSLTSLAYERIRTDILEGAWQAGDRLRIALLTERYEIGATAIREALSRLVTEGLVEFEEQRGFGVAAASIEELQDLTRTRIAIEQMALRRAIEGGDLDWETRVTASFHRLSKLSPPARDPEARAVWRAAHRAFHVALLEGCNSPWTLRLCAGLYDQTERYRSMAGQAAGNEKRDVLKEHRRLMEAVLARDAERACTLLARHFQATTDLILAGSALDEPTAPQRTARRRAS